jgi:hypothetical protein
MAKISRRTPGEHIPRIFPGLLAHVPAAFCRELPIVAPLRNAKVFDLLDNRWWAL